MSATDSPFAGLTEGTAEEQRARLEKLDAAQRAGTVFAPEDLRVLTRELPRVKDPRVWFFGWAILQRADVLPDALRLAEWLLSEPSEPGDLRRDPAFRYLHDKDEPRRDMIVARSLRSRDPGVLVSAASKVASSDRDAAIRGVLDAYPAAVAWRAHDVLESIQAWIEQLASPALVDELRLRIERADDEDVREQLEEWLEDTRGRVESGG